MLGQVRICQGSPAPGPLRPGGALADSHLAQHALQLRAGLGVGGPLTLSQLGLSPQLGARLQSGRGVCQAAQAGHVTRVGTLTATDGMSQHLLVTAGVNLPVARAARTEGPEQRGVLQTVLSRTPGLGVGVGMVVPLTPSVKVARVVLVVQLRYKVR